MVPPNGKRAPLYTSAEERALEAPLHNDLPHHESPQYLCNASSSRTPISHPSYLLLWDGEAPNWKQSGSAPVAIPASRLCRGLRIWASPTMHLLAAGSQIFAGSGLALPSPDSRGRDSPEPWLFKRCWVSPLLWIPDPGPCQVRPSMRILLLNTDQSEIGV